MIPVHYFIPVLFLLIFTKYIHSSVPFILNPGCSLPICNTTDNGAVFYGFQFVGEDTIHMLYSSFDELTINIIQTKKGYGPSINYTALYNGNYSGAISFGDTTPSNSFSLIIRRLMKFTDTSNSGHLYENDTSVESYWLNKLKTNMSRQDKNINQPSFQLPLEAINGLLTIDINYPGESTRDTNFPKLRSTSKSYFLNIALKADNIKESSTRFAFEFYVIQYGIQGTQLDSTSYIDDQYTPGIFNVWQLKSRSPIYSSSMLWKPIVYLNTDRSVEKNTLMQIYDLKNDVTLNQSIDQGIFRALYHVFYVSAFNISLGREKDGCFIKSNYSFIQLTAGLDTLDVDSVKQFITLALGLSLALPGLVAFIAIIFIIKRRRSQQRLSSYDPIDD